jgi:DNA-binding GntR family transcriptional regulator
LKKGLSRYVLTDEIYVLLKEQIITHTLTPGEKINIDQLSRELEVSNIPIREALSHLTAEGLVRMVPFKGMYVTNISLEDLDEIFEIRKELESLAIRKAALEIPESSLSDIEQSMGKWYELKPQQFDKKLQIISDMNRGIHGLILDYCGNQTLKQLVGMYIERIERYLIYIHQDLDLRFIEEEWNEHMQIVHYLQQQETSSAEMALKEHLKKSHDRTRSYFT